MPPRLARSSVQIAAPKSARNKNKKRNLEAYSIASHSTQVKSHIKPSRLGETLDEDAPKQKRRRVVEDEEGNEESAEEDVPALGKRRSAGVLDGDVEEGSDSSGNEWTLGGLREDDGDSDLDSDEAFGESDEERFDGFTFRGSGSGLTKRDAANGLKTRLKARQAKKAKEAGDIDLNENASEDEEGIEDDFGDEGVDLATMLDDNDEEMLGSKDTTGRDMGEESASEDEHDDESVSEASSDEESNDGGNEEERIARMRDRLEALDGANQSSQPKSQPSAPAALTVDDLLADLDPAQKKQFHAAIKTRKKSGRPTTLTAPLPKRQQDKINREVASAKAKEQLDRWRDTVIRNRRAEFLSFPLKDSDRVEPVGKDKFLVDDTTPQNELEENVRRIMVESGLASNNKAGNDGEAELIRAEELATNKLPVEEVMRRRADLRQARELLFREEIKAKRIKKIKSRAYRRVHRKERQRMAASDRELMGEASEDEREKADRKRAEARMSTKHRDSKFAKALRATNRTVWDEGARDAVNVEARRKEELRKRIAGDEVDDDHDGGRSDVSSVDDDDDDQGSDEDIRTLGQLGRLQGPSGGDRDETKGLRGMKFMRAADGRQRAQNDEDVERLKNELMGEDGEVESEIDRHGLGRAIFGPKGREKKQGDGKKVKRAEMEEGDVSEHGEDEDEKDVAIITEKPQQKNLRSTTGRVLASDTRAPGDRRGIGKEEGGESWIGKQQPKRARRRGYDADDGHVINTIADGGERSRDQQIPDPKPLSAKVKAKVAQSIQAGAQSVQTGEWTTVAYKDPNDDSASEASSDSNPILTPQQQKALQHQRAFAVDDDVQQAAFEAEKAHLAASEDEKEGEGEGEANYLPGWGSWTGEGLSKSIKKSNKLQQRVQHNPLSKAKKVANGGGINPATTRKDATLPNVILSEKSQRKTKPYLANLLPHGFETKQQYERSLRLPVGPEWSTKAVFQRATRPRIVVEPGVVVEAMERVGV